jgi:hypothetical protein
LNPEIIRIAKRLYTALHRDPATRYATADALAPEISKYLDYVEAGDCPELPEWDWRHEENRFLRRTRAHSSIHLHAVIAGRAPLTTRSPVRAEYFSA